MSRHQHVNSSGFPLQLAVARAVEEHLRDWSVLYEEHAWRTAEHQQGFIDVAIEWQHKTWVMNIECKRVRDTEWIFLRDASGVAESERAALWVTYFATGGNFKQFDWADVEMAPKSVESGMCIVPGQDAKAPPMLERVASKVAQSTEALAKEEATLVSAKYAGLRMYQNVIVTTAKLVVCDVDVSAIDIGRGEIPGDTQFREIPHVRFRKQLGASAQKAESKYEMWQLKSHAERLQSTVFVVNASHFVDFVRACSVDSNSLRKVCKVWD